MQDELLVAGPQRHGAGPDAEGLLLARAAAERWMAVLRAELPGIEHELLGAVPVGVDVHEHQQALFAQPAEAEVGDLDLLPLLRRQDDTGLGEPLRSIF